MKVRVAFAVVSRLEEPVLLVDEVLAVGDKAFKRKCYDRIEELIGAGRTLFLVSHSETDLRRFCDRGLYLRKGQLSPTGRSGTCSGSTGRTRGTLRERRGLAGRRNRRLRDTRSDGRRKASRWLSQLGRCGARCSSARRGRRCWVASP